MTHPLYATPLPRFENAELEKEAATLISSLQDQEMFRLAMKHSAIGMALVVPSGKWLQVNSALCHILGYTQSELLNIDFQVITHPDDLDADLDFVTRVLKNEIQTYSMEKRYIRKDKKVIWCLLTVSLVRDQKNEPAYFISQIQDISKEREAKDQLIAANDELEKLSYHLTHDIRSPLRSSITLLEIIRSASEEGDHQRSNELLGMMEKSLKKLNGLADDILSLTQISLTEETEELLNPRNIIEDSLDMLSHLDGMQRVNVIKDLKYKRAISTKKMRLSIIINNLISNAIKYQDPKAETPTIKISTYDDNGTFVFAVEDNGLGIDKQFRHRVFNMFERFHRSDVSGSGVGLYLVKTSAKTIGGRMRYIPLTNGSRFELRL